jgi:prefoldin subunit 5
LATVTGERFAALAGLGDEIARRTTALEAQGVTIDAGLATARHVTDAFAAFEARLQRVATSAAHLEGRAVTFDAQAAAIQHALSNANRAAATVDDVSARVDALAASGASLDRAADVVAAVEAAAHRCERIDADLAQHVGHIEAHEHRLAEATSRASALQAAVDSLDARVAALSQAQPVLLGAQATVERLERVAAEATAQLQTVATATADLERVLALAKTRTQGVAEYAERQTFEAELRRIGAGSLGQVVARAARRLGVAKRPVNWGSASSGAWTIDWAMGAGALALVVSLGVLLAGSRGQDGVVETTRRARLETVTPSAVTPSAAALAAVDAAVRDVAPRTVDIVLPPARARATASRAGAPKPKRIVPSGR